MNAMLPILAALSLGATASSAAPNMVTPFQTVTSSQTVTQLQTSKFQIAQFSRAEDTCSDQVRDRGLRVEEILETNEHSGGVEVVMRVSRRGDDYTVGCDYDDSSGDVELYRLENDRFDDRSRNDDFNDRFDNNTDRFGNGGEVSDRREAENIARAAVGDELGIDDPYSEIVEIKDIQRENRTWIVEGEANGAPFRVRIRASDSSVQDFQLY